MGIDTIFAAKIQRRLTQSVRSLEETPEGKKQQLKTLVSRAILRYLYDRRRDLNWVRGTPGFGQYEYVRKMITPFLTKRLLV